ncbi:MAG: class IV adenylate cyclase [Promethearchaeota archaeon]
MIEVEIKVAIPDPDLLRRKINVLNGKYILSLNHEDTYFNMPKGLRNFKETDEALRLRKSSEFSKINKDNTYLTKYFITYKGKKMDQITKTRKEIETEIKNFDNMKNLLAHLGFREIFIVKKERELYEFEFKNNKIDVLIDFLPILNQNFLEAEIKVENENELKLTKEIIFDFLKQFGITENDSIRESYLELIAKKLQME